MTEHTTVPDRRLPLSLRLPCQAAPIDRSSPCGAIATSSGINPSSTFGLPSWDWDDFFKSRGTPPFLPGGFSGATHR
jgi:hypothetical protein